ncbi:MAG TPA: asparagine synthase (glutamine-hydrolyzing) [Steroidobacteraceae bacterium]|nr:asparagine synthase (glutamine-hydrolyzing) [Steroidobacteraceae bacterium]
MTGFWQPGGRANAAQVAAMTDAIAHRGPDAAAHWVDAGAGVALGHRRLAIIDLSEAGAQPMHSACGRYVIVFNGEIYNFGALRQELEREGAQTTWRGHSDTEVVLTAISAWGLPAALRRFVGMFAFALWDRQRRTLHLARDRLGEKPLYYGWAGATFVFGSELKAITAYPGFTREVDRGALSLLLRHSYIPAPYCIYRGLNKLLQGTSLEITEQDAIARMLREPTAYWSLGEIVESGQRRPFAGADEEAVARLEELLEQAVAGQMIADVPLGAFLSGGVDSSLIVALMQKRSAKPVKTFTIGFQERDYDEAQYAAAVARHLGTEHTELYVTADQALGIVPKLPLIYDEPLADSSQIPTYLVAALARQHVTVALSGDAGDELFGGYNHYALASKLWRSIGWMPPGMRRMAGRAVKCVPQAAWNAMARPLRAHLPTDLRNATLGDKVHRFADIAAVASADDLFRQLLAHWKEPAQVVMRGAEPRTRFASAEGLPQLPDFEHRMMYLDALAYLTDDILVKVDRAAMAVSLETRVPLLDHRVVEFAWQLPLAMKVRNGTRKWLLRQVLYRHVPRELIERPKMGFGVPIGQWLRGPLRDWAQSLLDEPRLRSEGYFDPQPIESKWRQHLQGTRDWSAYLWDVLMFQAWLGSARS